MRSSIRLFFWLAAVAISAIPAVALPSFSDWYCHEVFSAASIED